MRAIVFAAGFVSCSTVASAQTLPQSTYLKLGAGLSVPSAAGAADVDPQRPLICGNAACTAPGTLNNIGNGTGLEAGVGFKPAPWLRTDLTVTHSGGQKLSDTDAAGRSFGATVSSTAVMVNAYAEIPGNFGGVRPFVGAGIGVANVATSNFTVVSAGGATTRVFNGGNSNNLAIQGSAGVTVPVAPNLEMDFGFKIQDDGRFVGSSGIPTINGVFNPAFTSAPGMEGQTTTKLFYVTARYFPFGP
jgi:opacity protein-like surface antigen